MHRLDYHGLRTDAIVERHLTSREINVRYQAGDRSVTSDIDWAGPLPEVGAPVVVEYDPGNPTWARQPGSHHDLDYAVVTVAVGGTLMVIFGLSVWGCIAADRSSARRWRPQHL